MSKPHRRTAVTALAALSVLAGGAGSFVASPDQADAAGPTARSAPSACKAWGFPGRFDIVQSNRVRVKIYNDGGQMRAWFRSTSGPTRAMGYYATPTFSKPSASTPTASSPASRPTR